MEVNRIDFQTTRKFTIATLTATTMMVTVMMAVDTHKTMGTYWFHSTLAKGSSMASTPIWESPDTSKDQLQQSDNH